ncbi:MAG: hypothetical protein KAY27_02790, partial [Pedobacter sp.]|nr:hypothetical protein [Pedobacter sp.]
MNKLVSLRAILLALFLTVGISVSAQVSSLRLYQPNQDELIKVIQHASALDTVLRNVAANNSIVPFWQADKSSFYYRRNLPSRNWEYIYVNAVSGVRKIAFDHARLAHAIETVTGKKQEEKRLRLSEMFFNKHATLLTVKAEGKWYQVNLSGYAIA